MNRCLNPIRLLTTVIHASRLLTAVIRILWAVCTGVQGGADRAGSCAGPQAGRVHMDAMAFGMGCCCLQVWTTGKLLLYSLCCALSGRLGIALGVLCVWD